MKKIKQKLAAREVVTMFNPDFTSPRLVEFVGGLGLDVALIDAERMSYDFERVEEMVRAAHVAGIAVVARPWLNEPGLILRYFDCGVDGVMVPHIEDGADAKKFVDYVRYARPKDHADKIIIIMAETPNAIAHIDEIVAVPGIDVVNLGVNDIAFAAGHPGEPDSLDPQIAVAAPALVVDNDLFEGLMTLDARGNILANTVDYKTSVPKLFAAGDMRRGQSLVVWAIREGRQAARTIDQFLMGESELPR